MNNHYPFAEETSRMYDSIIEEVSRKLNEQSSMGNLQMSESEIMTLSQLWKQKLAELRQNVKREQERPRVSTTFKFEQANHRPPQTIQEFEVPPQKKIKQEQIIKKEEEIGEEVVFEEDEEAKNGNDHVVESSQVIATENIERFEGNKREQEREKSIFDKVRELHRQRMQLIEERHQNEENDEDSDPESYSMYIYAQKLRGEHILNRIKPNKQQKANLENVLFKCGNQDQFIASNAIVTFNFKTDLKK